MEQGGGVFRALADPTRRAVLDSLFSRDGQTLNELCDQFPEMTRFGVMKHLSVLTEGNLVTTARQGRTKRHYLNPVPIEQVANRWISKYAARFTSALVALDDQVLADQQPEEPREGRMSLTAHVYQIYIAATPEQVWSAITESEWTRRYFHTTSFVEPPQQGRPYLTIGVDGRPAVDGIIEEMQRPAAGRPGRFVQTWHTRYDPELEHEPPSRVEWTIESAGEGLTRVRLVHGNLEQSPLTWQNVKDGWVWILNSMKTLLETGHPLPRVRDDESVAEAVSS
ncbi:MAG TPA: SRPBCC domain-containing protein [Propionibacteriaceae bacterium]|nr:SRPBCC domain-containing protein [Propionibacteriaceae bacterium]